MRAAFSAALVFLGFYFGAPSLHAAKRLLEFSAADRVFVTGSAGDAAGNVYLCGYTDQPSALPGPVRRFGPAPAAGYDLFVIKLGANGRPLRTLVLGGSGSEYNPVIAVNAQGQVVIAGGTASTNFPVKNPLANIPANATGLFACQFNATLTDQLFGTYLGADGSLAGVALDSAGNIFLAGTAYYSGFINAPDTVAGPFVAKLSPDGSSLLYMRQVGTVPGTVPGTIRALAVDGDGRACVVGDVFHGELPILNALQPRSARLDQGADSFLARLDPDGELLNSTFLGGACGGTLDAVAYNAAKEIFVAGRTFSADLPGAPPSTTNCSGINGFLLKLDSGATNVLQAVTLDFGGAESIRGLAVKPDGTALVGGMVNGYSLGQPFLATVNPAGEVVTHYPQRECGWLAALHGMALTPSGAVVLHGPRARSAYGGGWQVARVSAEELDSEPRPFVDFSPAFRGALVSENVPSQIEALPIAFRTPVESVSFYDRGRRVGRVTSPPYVMNLSTLSRGAHSLTAEVRSGGRSFTSCAVPFTVRSPRNDNFARRIKITGSRRTIRGDTMGASREGSEPGDYGSESVWYSWRAPADGLYEVSVTPASHPYFVANVYANVFTGDSLTTLTSVVENPLGFPAISGVTTFPAQPGKEYHIRVDSYGYARFRLALRQLKPPENDRFSAAIPLTGAARTNGALHDASFELGEAFFDYGGKSVWYRWSTPTPGLFLAAVPYGLGTVSVFTGTNLTNLVAVGQHVYGLTNGPAFYAAADQNYFISVSTYGVATNFTLIISPQVVPANDDFANRFTIPPGTLTATGSCLGATTENDESGNVILPERTVWWRWVAPTSGAYRSTLEVPMAPLAVNVDGLGGVMRGVPGARPNRPPGSGPVTFYSGNELGQLTDLTGPFSYRTDDGWYFEQGVEYQIAVSADASFFRLQLALLPHPANDDFAHAQPLTGFLTATGTTSGASLEPGEPGDYYYGAQSSVWYSWIAPSNGLFALDSTGAALLRTGGTLASLEPVTMLGGGSLFQAEAGTQYFVAVVASSSFTLRVRPPHFPANDNFAQAKLLAGINIPFSLNPAEATAEPGEPEHLPGEVPVSSVWYSWVAPVDGTFSLRRVNNSYVGASIYTGDVLTNLTQVDSSYYRALDFTATNGQRFFFSVDARGRTEIFRFQLRHHPRPSNDNFENALALSGLSVSIVVTNLGATAETNEPVHNGYAVRHSVWHSWTAPMTGRASFILANDIDGVGYGSVLSLYEGDTLTSLTQLLPPEWQVTSFNVPVEAGRTYHLAIDGEEFEDGVTSGTGTLTIRYASVPVNDDFASRLGVTNGQGSGTVEGASRDPSDPETIYDSQGPTVWWTYTPQTNGVHRVAFTGSDWLLAGVYRGAAPASLELISGNDYYTPVRFIAQAGEPVAIVFYAPVGSLPDYDFTVTYEPPPPNDFFTNRIAFMNTARGTLLGATVEPGETNHLDGAGASVWWSWTAPESGFYEMPLVEPTRRYTLYDVTVRLYAGSSLAQLEPVPPRSSPFPSRARYFHVVAGTTYAVSVDSVNLSGTEFVLTPVHRPGPTNDHFANRALLTGLSLSATGTTRYATLETGEPDWGTASVWYSWRAVQDGTAAFHIDIGHRLDFFLGDSVESVGHLAGTVYLSRTGSVVVAAGVDYKLRVTQEGFYWGQAFTFTIETTPAAPNAFALSPAPATARTLMLLGEGVIQTSTNLVDWQPWRTNLSATPLSIPVGTEPQRFFRVR